MSFAPQDRSRAAFRLSVRTFLFWVLMILLGGLVWQTAALHPGSGTAEGLKYSDFMQQVDKSNVASADFLMSQNTARARGNLRAPVRRYSVTVPKEVIPDLTERLRKQNVPITVSDTRGSNLSGVLLNFAPLILLVLFWIYVMKKRAGGTQTSQ